MVIVNGMLVLLAVADPAAAPLKVTGATTCPAPPDVEAALIGLVPSLDPASPPDEAELRADADSVVVSLRRGSGEPIGDKRVDAGLSCEQRARAAAVIIAAWEARLGVHTNLLVVEPTETPTGSAPAAVVAAPPPLPTVLPAWPTSRVEIGVGAGASINGAALAPAAAIDLAYLRPAARLVPSVAATFVGAHQMSVGGGSAHWRRFGLTAAAGSRRSWAPIWAEGRAGVALTLLDISGSSFPRNGSGVTFDPGVQLGLRGGLTVSRSQWWHWWLDATLAFWPRGQTVYVDGAPGSAPLPRGEALLSLGTSYGGSR